MNGEGGAEAGRGRLLAHIGMHKTGSTWFRTRFYPKVRNYRLVPREALRAAFFAPHALLFDPALARESLGLASPGNVVLCDEAFSGYPHTGGHRGALQRDRLARLHAVRPDARLVLFIRRQQDAILSAYRWYVKGGGTHSLRMYLTGGTGRDIVPRFEFDHYNYLALYEYCAGLFGADRVRCYLYEEFAEDSRAFLARYASALGMDVDLGEVSLAPENQGYTARAARAARAMNLFARGANDFKYYLVPVPGMLGVSRVVASWLSSALGGPPIRLPPDLAAEVAERFRASNHELGARLALDLARFGYSALTHRVGGAA